MLQITGYGCGEIGLFPAGSGSVKSINKVTHEKVLMLRTIISRILRRYVGLRHSKPTALQSQKAVSAYL